MQGIINSNWFKIGFMEGLDWARGLYTRQQCHQVRHMPPIVQLMGQLSGETTQVQLPSGSNISPTENKRHIVIFTNESKQWYARDI